MDKVAWQLGNGSTAKKGTGKAIEDLPYIADTSHIRVRKYWRYVFILVFILSKVFLATSIYFFLEYKHYHEQVKNPPLQINHK
jgi:hypothetical protein